MGDWGPGKADNRFPRPPLPGPCIRALHARGFGYILILCVPDTATNERPCMAIVDDLPHLERLLNDLVTRYEQYFIGLEKREPLPLLGEVEKIVRRYAGTPINNTMYKHRYQMLVARFNTYREHWNRTVRLIEEGKYSRDRFISDLHRRQSPAVTRRREEAPPQPRNNDLERVFQEFREARQACNLPVDKLSRDMVAATIEKSRPALAARLGTDDLTFRVVVEGGKPKIKASQRKQP